MAKSMYIQSCHQFAWIFSLNSINYSLPQNQLGDYPVWLILYACQIILPMTAICIIAIKIVWNHGKSLQREFMPNVHAPSLMEFNTPNQSRRSSPLSQTTEAWFLNAKGQTKSKWFFQTNISPKKQTNQFYFTTYYETSGRHVFIRFLEEI